MQNQITILYVEDDETLSFMTKDNLEMAGYKVIHYTNGIEAINHYTTHSYDICLLDIMLPKLDGFELARRIRKIDNAIPILFLTAKQNTDDKILGFNLGADDYITKPFNIEELKLKIEVFLKRRNIVDENKIAELNTFNIGSFNLNVLNQTLYNGNKHQKLTKRETDLLKLFFENPDILLKRQDILWRVWGNDEYFSGRSLDVFVTRLRKFLKNDKCIKIENVHGTGFRLSTLINQ